MVERQGERLGLEAHHRIRVPVDDLQIRVGAPHFDLELGPHLGRLGPGKAALPGAESHQDQLVVLTALQLERPPVGPVRHNGFTQLGQRQRPVEPGGIRRGKVPNDLPEEALQIRSCAQSPTGRPLGTLAGMVVPRPDAAGSVSDRRNNMMSATSPSESVSGAWTRGSIEAASASSVAGSDR